MAGVDGIGPPFSVLETDVMPLYQAPKNDSQSLFASRTHYLAVWVGGSISRSAIRETLKREGLVAGIGFEPTIFWV